MCCRSAACCSAGYDVVRLNLRDHGATHHLNRDIFHSCRLAEVVGATRALAQRFPGARLYLAGFSLGGNFMLRVAADAQLPDAVAGVVAVSPVLDPEVTLAALETGPAIYRRSFLKRWSRSLRRKQRAWPGVHDFAAMLRLRQLRSMTAGLVALCTDFPSLAAYLDGYAVTGERLATLRVPATLLLADDDPIVPSADLSRLAPSAQLTVVRSRYGGHCGFAAGVARPSRADQFVLEQFERFDLRRALISFRSEALEQDSAAARGRSRTRSMPMPSPTTAPSPMPARRWHWGQSFALQPRKRPPPPRASGGKCDRRSACRGVRRRKLQVVGIQLALPCASCCSALGERATDGAWLVLAGAPAAPDAACSRHRNCGRQAPAAERAVKKRPLRHGDQRLRAWIVQRQESNSSPLMGSSPASGVGSDRPRRRNRSRERGAGARQRIWS